ncbi:dienelactone hydrolase family protein [Alteromonas pelagimontana]|uniref:Dienelactone hydrolase family protein n=1 Tax=Alteromonas pelagimontana TaxID=1858656 RepID=A0A6M4MCD9_9ALTE|nr:dienelactone hydrolase family protein [Alteromonas pelagimontana]QJR80320.1 dienelactone hydrolase family protein [Alteromonas pelagimontana]
MQIIQETKDLTTPTGTMRCYIYRPNATGRFPAIIFYSEIFQHTAPIGRSAATMASHGFVVVVPEVFHELNPIGTVLGYDDAGKEKGNNDKWQKPLADHDQDTKALVNYCQQADYCTGNVGAMGVCLGGHLAYRAALHPDVKAAFCLYATDIHSHALPAPEQEQSLTRMNEIQGEVFFVWGKQDPHVPQEGRLAIYQQCLSTGINYQWLEVNAVHAFMRDEGERYDGALALQMYQQAVAFFQRLLFAV